MLNLEFQCGMFYKYQKRIMCMPIFKYDYIYSNGFIIVFLSIKKEIGKIIGLLKHNCRLNQ